MRMRPLLERGCILQKSFIHHIILNPEKSIIPTYFWLIKKIFGKRILYYRQRSEPTTTNVLLCYCAECVCMSTQQPSFGKNTALPHAIVILLIQMVDKQCTPGQAGYSVTLNTVRDRGCLASCLWSPESVLTHQLSMIFPQSFIPQSMNSDEDCQGGMAVGLYFRTVRLKPRGWCSHQQLGKIRVTHM